jgi:hypothetical protein
MLSYPLNRATGRLDVRQFDAFGMVLETGGGSVKFVGLRSQSSSVRVASKRLHGGCSFPFINTSDICITEGKFGQAGDDMFLFT